MNGIVFPRVKLHPGNKKPYELLDPIFWQSRRYGRVITVEAGFRSDGASGPARDIESRAWFIHDKACTTWTWDDGTPISLWQSSMILKDVLSEEGHVWIAPLWAGATWLGLGFRRLASRVF